MDWKPWLSRTRMEQSVVDHCSSIFSQNQLEENHIISFDRELLGSMGITIAEHQKEILKLVKKEKFSKAINPAKKSIRSILKLVKKEKFSKAINPAKKSIRSIGNMVWQCVSGKLHHICTVASFVANAVLPNRISAVNSAPETNGDGEHSASEGSNGDSIHSASEGSNGDSIHSASEDSNESNDVSVGLDLSESNGRRRCRLRRLPHELRSTKILGLSYTNSGNAILALASNGTNLRWDWQKSYYNRKGKATTSVPPPICKYSENQSTNYVLDLKPKDSTPYFALLKWVIVTHFMYGIASTTQLCCRILMKKGSKSHASLSCFALSNSNYYSLSATGGKISLFQVNNLKKLVTFMSPPPIASSIAFHPEDDNVIAIGMDDSSILIHNIQANKLIIKLNGHSKRITGLAFSNPLKVLVSSDADNQICIWGYDGWEKKNTKSLTIPDGRTTTGGSNTRVKFDDKQKQFLVVHETHLAVYEATNLECVKQWVATESSISDATYSSGSHLVFACFLNATVFIFDASHLTIRCRIIPSCYLPRKVRSIVYPLVIAAHPQYIQQFVLGFSDGRIILFELVVGSLLETVQ